MECNITKNFIYDSFSVWYKSYPSLSNDSFNLNLIRASTQHDDIKEHKIYDIEDNSWN